MAIITLPASFGVRHVDWSLNRPTQVNVSSYSGKRTVVANPWHGTWSARLELAPIVGEANVRPVRAFLAKLKGQTNTFLLPATEGAQHSSPATQASAIAAQGATSIVLTSAPILTAGMLATVTLPSGNRQMVMLTADIAGSTITFEPPLREAIAAGASVETANPTCHVALSDSAFGYSVGPGIVYNLSLNVDEAF